MMAHLDLIEMLSSSALLNVFANSISGWAICELSSEVDCPTKLNHWSLNELWKYTTKMKSNESIPPVRYGFHISEIKFSSKIWK